MTVACAPFGRQQTRQTPRNSSAALHLTVTLGILSSSRHNNFCVRGITWPTSPRSLMIWTQA
eukprot:4570971-Karenia_brevis.AAC.1